MEPPARVETTSGIDNDEFPDSKLIDSKDGRTLMGELEMRFVWDGGAQYSTKFGERKLCFWIGLRRL